jgi:uncharacterized protein with PIN domain
MNEMPIAYFRFFANLNDFLPPGQRAASIPVPLPGIAAVKHPIESLGVPHPEIELILANGQPVDFRYQVQADDQIEVFPPDAAPAIEGAPLLRPPLAPPLRFVLDTHLGQLATYLRLLGFDSSYRNDYDDAELACISQEQQRVLLTRDRGLLKRKSVVYGYCVRVNESRQQLIDVMRRYRLLAEICPWRRCLRCNGLLEPAEKAQVLDQLAPKTRLYYDVFQRCQACGQIYWQGSHHARMQAFVEGVLREVSEAGED